MVKRLSISLNDVAAHDNLLLATWKAARGKRSRPEVAAFLEGLDESLEQLADDIRSGAAPRGRFSAFHIRDPKRRLIHAACFEDRVLHHAILNLAEPVFERSLAASTYACRPGMGSHAAVVQVRRNLQRFAWYVKVDVAGYFPAIDHAVLMGLLARRFKGAGFLALLGRIVGSYEAAPGKGLPIGSLTSQHFANHYLDGADRLLLAHPAVRAHVRYMDDMVWWCDSRADALQVLAELAAYLAQARGLTLKPEPEINRSSHGITFCGYRVRPGAVLLTARKRRRYVALRKQWEGAWLHGAVDSLALQRAYDAVHAMTLHADSTAWRRASLRLHPSVADHVAG